MANALTIRAPQLQALGLLTRDALHVRLTEALQSHWPALVERLGEESCLYFVEQAIERCGFYGLETRRDHFRYLNVMALLGADFDEEKPWARDILELRQLRGTARLDRLVAVIRAKAAGGDL